MDDTVALSRITKLLDAQPPAARQRVMIYLNSRYAASGEPSATALRMRRYRERNEGVTRYVTRDVTGDVTEPVTRYDSDIKILDTALAEKQETARKNGHLETSEPTSGNKRSKEVRENAVQILRFLNEKTGKNFREIDTNLNLISARLLAGASLQDCKSVVARQWLKWRDNPEMKEYARPATLFNKTKFEQYLGEMS